MANGVKIFLRILVVLLILGAIAGAVLYFTSRVPDQKQVFATYKELAEDKAFKDLNNALKYEPGNKFLVYGNSVLGHENEFKAILLSYDANMAVFDDVCFNLYYVNNSTEQQRQSINEKLERLKTTAEEALVYSQIFETQQTQFGSLNSQEVAELEKTFGLFQAKFLAHVNLMNQTMSEIYNMIISCSLGNGSDFSLKYQLIGFVVGQCKAMSDVSSDMSVYSQHFSNLDKFLSKYEVEKVSNFTNGSKTSNSAYNFLQALSKVDEQEVIDNFIKAVNKQAYYNQLTSVDKQLFTVIYDYFGF